MKKLMIAVAAIAAAVVANATTFNWGIQSGSLDTTKFANGSMMYLFHGDAAPDLSSMTVKAFTLENISAETGDSLAVLNITGGTKVDNTLTLNNGAAVLGATPNVTSYGTSSTGIYNVYAVVISTDGSYAAVSSLKTPNIGTSPAPSLAMWSASNFTTYDAKDPEPTPEPTSAMLMLLGVAGLALRRKQK